MANINLVLPFFPWLYALRNKTDTFSGLLGFFSTQESLHEPTTSFRNHNSDTSLVFFYVHTLAIFVTEMNPFSHFYRFRSAKE